MAKIPPAGAIRKHSTIPKKRSCVRRYPESFSFCDYDHLRHLLDCEWCEKSTFERRRVDSRWRQKSKADTPRAESEVLCIRGRGGCVCGGVGCVRGKRAQSFLGVIPKRLFETSHVWEIAISRRLKYLRLKVVIHRRFLSALRNA